MANVKGYRTTRKYRNSRMMKQWMSNVATGEANEREYMVSLQGTMTTEIGELLKRRKVVFHQKKDKFLSRKNSDWSSEEDKYQRSILSWQEMDPLGRYGKKITISIKTSSGWATTIVFIHCREYLDKHKLRLSKFFFSEIRIFLQFLPLKVKVKQKLTNKQIFLQFLPLIGIVKQKLTKKQNKWVSKLNQKRKKQKRS